MALILHPSFLPEEPVPAQWDSLPLDCVRLVCGCLDAGGLAALGSTCRHCRQVTDEDWLWRKLLLQRFGWHPSKPPKQGEWKRLYRYNTEVLRGAVALEQEMAQLMSRSMLGRQQGQQYVVPSVPTGA